MIAVSVTVAARGSDIVAWTLALAPRRVNGRERRLAGLSQGDGRDRRPVGRGSAHWDEPGAPLACELSWQEPPGRRGEPRRLRSAAPSVRGSRDEGGGRVVSLLELRPDDPRWRRFTEAARDATTFHDPDWLAALSESYGYRA